MGKIEFATSENEDDWVMRLDDEGIFFNRAKWSKSSPDVFALAVVGILENRFAVKFERKESPYDEEE